MFTLGFEKLALNRLKRFLKATDPAYASNLKRAKSRGSEAAYKNMQIYAEKLHGKEMPVSGGFWGKKVTLDQKISGRRRYKDKPGTYSIIKNENPGNHRSYAAVDTKTGKRIAQTEIAPTSTGPAGQTKTRYRPNSSETHPEFRRQGVMSNMYKQFSKEHGKLYPGSKQTDLAKKLWNGRKEKA